jgi:hypothetical protein
MILVNAKSGEEVDPIIVDSRSGRRVDGEGFVFAAGSAFRERYGSAE